MIVLDTDVLSIVQRADGPTYDRLAQRLDAADDEVAVSIVSPSFPRRFSTTDSTDNSDGRTKLSVQSVKSAVNTIWLGCAALSNQWLNPQNFRVRELGLVTMFWPLMTPAERETVVQTAGEATFVVDRKVKPATFVGRIKITLPKESWSLAAG